MVLLAYGLYVAFYIPEAIAIKKTLLAAEQDRPDVARYRTRWKKYQKTIDAKRLVFIDETWTKTTMTPLRGWSEVGQRLIGKVPQGKRWRTLTFIAGLRYDKMIAPAVVEGAMNRELFNAWVMEHLLPTLSPGDVIIFDNLSSHKDKKLRQACREHGVHRLFLPPYSPDLNPIEKAFSKLKSHLRRAGERCLESLSYRIGKIVSSFSPQECKNYFKASGYIGSI